MDSIQKLPPWATTIIIAIVGYLIVTFVSDIRDEIRQMRMDIKAISEVVAVHGARIENLERKK